MRYINSHLTSTFLLIMVTTLNTCVKRLLAGCSVALLARYTRGSQAQFASALALFCLNFVLQLFGNTVKLRISLTGLRIPVF